MNPKKKLGLYIVGVNIVGILVSVAVTLIWGLFEGLIVFPFVILVASLFVYSKQKRENSGNSDNDNPENLIISED